MFEILVSIMEDDKGLVLYGCELSFEISFEAVKFGQSFRGVCIVEFCIGRVCFIQGCCDSFYHKFGVFWVKPDMGVG